MRIGTKNVVCLAQKEGKSWPSARQKLCSKGTLPEKSSTRAQLAVLQERVKILGVFEISKRQ